MAARPHLGGMTATRVLLVLVALLLCVHQRHGAYIVMKADSEYNGWTFEEITDKLDRLMRLAVHEPDHEKSNQHAWRIRKLCVAASMKRTKGRLYPFNSTMLQAVRGKRVAIAYFGLTRSLKSLICNLYAQVYYPLEHAGVKVDSYLHTFNLRKLQATHRNPEESGKTLLESEEYRILGTTAVSVTNQSEWRSSIDISQFQPKKNRKKTAQGEDVLWNILSQFRSLELVTDLWVKSGVKYDAVLYIRPDMAWLNAFPVELIHEILHAQKERDGQEIYVGPSWKQSLGRNDRFGGGTPGAMAHFGRRLEAAMKYVVEMDQPIHAERFLKYHMGRPIGSGEPAAFLPILDVPLVRVRHSCPNLGLFSDAMPYGWMAGDPFVRKGCQVAHQDCENFPFLEGQPEEEVFFPRLPTKEGFAEVDLPQGTRHSRTCDPADGVCKDLGWQLRARYVINELTEPELMKWGRHKGWAGLVYMEHEFRNGSVKEYIIPDKKRGNRFLELWYDPPKTARQEMGKSH